MCQDIDAAAEANANASSYVSPDVGNANVSAGNSSSSPEPSPVPPPCFQQTCWGVLGCECTAHVKSCAPFATSALDASHPLLTDYRRSALLKVTDACESAQCGLIGDGTCQPELNTAACGWDGGDCCLRTSRMCRQPGWDDDDFQTCLDPAEATFAGGDPWHALGRHALQPTKYSCKFDTDGTADPNPPIAEHKVYDVMDVPESYRALYSDFSAVNATLWNNSNAYTFNVFEAIVSGTPLVWTPLPNLPYYASNYRTEADAAPFRDFPFEAQAGEYLIARVNSPVEDVYVELIAPEPDGSRADPSRLNTTSLAVSSVPEGYSENDGSSSFNASAALAWHRDSCTCYACFCSCEGSVGDRYSLTAGPRRGRDDDPGERRRVRSERVIARVPPARVRSQPRGDQLIQGVRRPDRCERRVHPEGDDDQAARRPRLADDPHGVRAALRRSKQLRGHRKRVRGLLLPLLGDVPHARGRPGGDRGVPLHDGVHDQPVQGGARGEEGLLHHRDQVRRVRGRGIYFIGAD
jgi:hypothetical protein